MLKEGGRAPAFSAEADGGKKVSLKDYKGQPLVLYFYPKDDTTGCTKEACDFRDSIAQFKRLKTAVLGVSKDSVEKHEKFKKKYNLNFPLLSDEEGKICEAYGVWKQKSMYGRKYMGIERTTFLIDSSGKVAKIYPKVKIPGHIDAVLADLKEIQ
ncbi:thioredoxin-dependent thiol peroxidase [bacterium]|nr:thioredoxin-dependent thiol peroxidase [bacterium]